MSRDPVVQAEIDNDQPKRKIIEREDSERETSLTTEEIQKSIAHHADIVKRLLNGDKIKSDTNNTYFRLNDYLEDEKDLHKLLAKVGTNGTLYLFGIGNLSAEEMRLIELQARIVASYIVG